MLESNKEEEEVCWAHVGHTSALGVMWALDTYSRVLGTLAGMLDTLVGVLDTLEGVFDTLAGVLGTPRR